MGFSNGKLSENRCRDAELLVCTLSIILEFQMTQLQLPVFSLSHQVKKKEKIIFRIHRKKMRRKNPVSSASITTLIKQWNKQFIVKKGYDCMKKMKCNMLSCPLAPHQISLYFCIRLLLLEMWRKPALQPSYSSQQYFSGKSSNELQVGQKGAYSG